MISISLSRNIKRRGFTLIELVLVMAIFLIIIVIAFSILSSYFAVRSANDQELILQQNFRAALDRIALDFRQASSNPAISSPDGNKVSNTLAFTSADNKTISYYLKDNTNGTHTLMRKEGNEEQPVTEDMHQLVDLYFIRSGGKIVLLIAGDMTYFGKERKISFASMVFSRNANYEGQQTP
jgi:prepilin-type N-terminal cleavage/methylation domain-containing protein